MHGLCIYFCSIFFFCCCHVSLVFFKFIHGIFYYFGHCSFRLLSFHRLLIDRIISGFAEDVKLLFNYQGTDQEKVIVFSLSGPAFSFGCLPENLGGGRKEMINPYIQYMYSYPHKTAYRPLAGVSLKEYAPLLAGSGHGLYLHIPFCEAKCGYCNLFSVTGQEEGAIDRYLDTVERQGRQYRELLAPFGTEFSELAIGGGTPLYLKPKQVERMFGVLNQCFHFSSGRGTAAEITGGIGTGPAIETGMETAIKISIETAPNQTSMEKLLVLRQSGVTRVSMGIQSFHDSELATLKRQHHAREAKAALELLKSAGFPCVNVDFIYGIPGQTSGSLLVSLKEALAWEPDEIFLYPLYVKNGVGLRRQEIVPDVQAAYRQYQDASFFLRSEGFRQDSMRRFVRLKRERTLSGGGFVRRKKERALSGGGFVRPKREWALSGDGAAPQEAERAFSECGFGTSLALGCGGRSYLGKLHFCSPYAVTQKECMARLVEYENTEDFTNITHGILLSDEEQKRRYAIRHLFIRPGLPLGRYEGHFGSRTMEDFPVLSRWLEEGFAQERTQGDGRYLALTEKGLGLSDYLGPQLISSRIQSAMEEWEENHVQALSTTTIK